MVKRIGTIIAVLRLRRLVSICLVFLVATLPAQAGVLNDLAGRWSGWGAVRMSNGGSEQVKCVATYFVNDAGTGVEQNLRCASTGYKIDAKANIQVQGNSVSGSWEERTHSNRGVMQGTVDGNLFKLAVKGDSFSANITMSSTKCKQSISLTPQGVDIISISIGLEKC